MTMELFGNEQKADIDGIARVKVIGVGGGGCNAVNRMYRERVPHVEYLAVNTDAQHLVRLDVPVKIRIGDMITRGLGVGGDPEIGRTAAEESREEIYELVRGADMLFIASGMGGGTGTGAAPVVAEIARETGALTIAVVTKPFRFEGRKRSKNADDGLSRLREAVDTLIVVPNDRLGAMCDEDLSAEDAFRLADDVLRLGVKSIAELVTVPGEINLDFADVKTIMTGAGPAWMSIGSAHGENRAIEAAKSAIHSPMLDVNIEGARGVLLNITGGANMTLKEVAESRRRHRQLRRPGRQHHLRHGDRPQDGRRDVRHHHRHRPSEHRADEPERRRHRRVPPPRHQRRGGLRPAALPPPQQPPGALGDKRRQPASPPIPHGGGARSRFPQAAPQVSRSKAPERFASGGLRISSSIPRRIEH